MLQSKTTSLKSRQKRISRKVNDYNDLLMFLNKAQHVIAVTQVRLKTNHAKKAATQFSKQLDLILSMLTLPYGLLMMMEGQTLVLKRGLKAAMGAISQQSFNREQVLDAMMQTKATPEEFKKVSKNTIRNFFLVDDLRVGWLTKPWMFAMIVYIWTAFESLAGDLWETALNNRVETLGHKALLTLPKEDSDSLGFSSQHVKVGLIAKHGFDLRSCLGTVLKTKFDFTSVDGIIHAYSKIFESCQKLDEATESLKELEQYRNVIVHRGGVIDEKFLRITGIKAKRGTTITLKLPEIADYVASITYAGTALLEIADR